MPDDVDHRLREWADAFATQLLSAPLPMLRVLVWGPSLDPPLEEGNRRLLQKKRETIIGDLRKLGHVAATSEELLKMAQQTPGLEKVGTRPLHQVEAHQLQNADFAIVLLGSPGTVAEVAGLLTNRTFARRSAVFCHAAEVAGSYMEAGPLKGLDALGVLHGYDDEELAACRVAARAIEFVKDQSASLGGTTP